MERPLFKLVHGVSPIFTDFFKLETPSEEDFNEEGKLKIENEIREVKIKEGPASAVLKKLEKECITGCQSSWFTLLNSSSLYPDVDNDENNDNNDDGCEGDFNDEKNGVKHDSADDDDDDDDSGDCIDSEVDRNDDGIDDDDNSLKTSKGLVGACGIHDSSDVQLGPGQVAEQFSQSPDEEKSDKGWPNSLQSTDVVMEDIVEEDEVEMVVD